MALMNPTMGAMPSDTDDDPEYTAAVQSGDLQKLFSLLEREQGLPAGYLRKTAQIESRMNPSAQNPKSSAGGLFQQTNGNARQYGIEDKFDPVQSALGAAMFAGDNANFLSGKLGRDPTAGELYLAHQQGPGGAAALLSNPNASAASVVGNKAASLNGGAGLSAQQFASKWTSKLDNPADMPSQDAIPVSMDSGKTGFSVPLGGGAGLMNKPSYEAYKPSDDGVDAGSIFSALGAALLSGTRQNPLGNLPVILAQQQAARDKREDRRYGMYKDNRDFSFRQTESDRAQGNSDRGFGLQEKQFDLSKSNTDADNARADKQFELQQQQALQPKIMQDGSGGIVAVKPDGTGVTTLAPGQRIQTEAGKVSERDAIAKERGLEPGTDAYNQYILNGKLPEGGVKAPTTRNIKQADGSEVAVQWDASTGKWIPLTAPEGGNPVKPGGGKPLTEAQGKDIVFYDRAAAAHDTLNTKGTALQSGPQQTLNKVPGVGNFATSEDFKLAKNAEELFLSAFLRKESGAAISDPEYARYQKMFIPRPGDPPKVVEQLAENRRIALESVKAGMPPAIAAARVTEANPAKVLTQAEYDELKPGMHYIDPFGKKRVKGGAQ